MALFSKLKYADQGHEKVHSFVLLATSRFIELPYEDEQQLYNSFRESLQAGVRPEWLKSLETFSDHEETQAGQSEEKVTSIVTPRARCIRYRMQRLDEDRSSGQSGQFLTLELRGRLCLHPFHPAYVIDVSYSQRSRQGEWDDTFDTEADLFLKSLAFEPVSLSEYVSKKFNEYAALLNKLGRQSEATKIKQYADRIGQPASEKSTYLGFDARGVLLEYADLLRTQNDIVEAKRMQILAERWRVNNLAAFLKQQTQRKN
jgi:hypothetical protein